MCLDPIDGFACSTTAVQLDGVSRLRQLAGLDATTGKEFPSPPKRSVDVSAAALEALEAISQAEATMTEFEGKQSQTPAAQEEQIAAEAAR